MILLFSLAKWRILCGRNNLILLSAELISKTISVALKKKNWKQKSKITMQQQAINRIKTVSEDSKASSLN